MGPEHTGFQTDNRLADKGYLNHLESIAEMDVAKLLEAEKSYGNSWKKRGGWNTYAMLCRKFDRMEHQVEKHNWDIFRAIESDTRTEGIVDDIRDLRRYLILVEAEMMARGLIS